MARYSVSARTTNAPTTTLPGASLYAIANANLRVNEIGIFNTTTTACAISVNRLDSAGTQGTGLTEGFIGDPSSAIAPQGTGFQSHTSTPPTLGEELVRASLGAAIGAGMVWTFDLEPLLIPAGTTNGIGILAATGTGQIVDFYIIWTEWVAFPTVPTAGANTLLSSVTAAAGTTHTFPSLTTLDNASGDLLIAIIALYQASATGNAFSSWGGGSTEFPSGDSSSATNPSIAMGCAYKFSDGTETGTFTVTSSISGRAAMFLLGIKAAHLSTVPEVTFSAATTTTAQDPPSLNPAGWDVEDTLWIAVAGGGETSLAGTWTGISAAPTNYTDFVATAIAGGDVVGAVQAAVGFRQLAAASDGPGAFTTDTSPEIERAATIAVRPVPSTLMAWVSKPRVAWSGAG